MNTASNGNTNKYHGLACHDVNSRLASGRANCQSSKKLVITKFTHPTAARHRVFKLRSLVL